MLDAMKCEGRDVAWESKPSCAVRWLENTALLCPVVKGGIWAEQANLPSAQNMPHWGCYGNWI